MLHLALAGMAVFGTEVINSVEVILVLYDGLCVEQWLAVIALRGARLQFKKYSVCLTWHSRYVSNSIAKVRKIYNIIKVHCFDSAEIPEQARLPVAFRVKNQLLLIFGHKVTKYSPFFRTFTRSFNMFCDMIDQIIEFNIMSPLLGDGYKAGGSGEIKTGCSP